MKKKRVVFLPEGITVFSEPGAGSVLELAREAGIPLAGPCGGRGTCGKCRVLASPAPEPTEAEKKALPAAALEAGYRLACRLRVGAGDLTVTVPPESRFLASKSPVPSARRKVEIDHPVRKFFLALEKPSLEDQDPDWERLRGALARAAGLEPSGLEISLALLRALPVLARENDFRLTAVLAGRRVVSLEAGDTGACSYGVALDLGTTSLAGVLADLGSGAEMAVADAANPQASWGSDVISRINHTIEKPGGLEEIGRSVTGALDSLILELCRKAGVEPAHVYQVTVAGNTVMEHLLARLPASALAGSPYVGVHRSAFCFPAGELGLSSVPSALVYLAPLVSGFVGGDTVSGILACDFARDRRRRLFVDIGTNGEIVVSGKNGLWCAAAAAGPAFEGASVRQGMRAEPGAIDGVRLSGGRVEITTVGQVAARGICGTGLVAAVAEMLRAGIVSPEGRLRPPAELEGPAAAFAVCLGEENGEVFLRLCASTGVAVYQRDIRQLQLAKAALATGIEIVLGRAGLAADDLEEIVLAGAFGACIDPADAFRIGLMPPGAEPGRVVFAGNTSLAGSRLMLLSGSARREAGELGLACRCVELFHEPGFMESYTGHMMFPAGNPSSPDRECR